MKKKIFTFLEPLTRSITFLEALTFRSINFINDLFSSFYRYSVYNTLIVFVLYNSVTSRPLCKLNLAIFDMSADQDHNHSKKSLIAGKRGFETLKFARLIYV